MHVTASTASSYVRTVVATTMTRRGFDSAEAGALAEAERLLENHIQRLYTEATHYAQLAGRATPHAADLLAAQEESLKARKLRREAKRRRKGRPREDKPVSQPSGDTVAPEFAYDGAPPYPDDWTYRTESAPGPPDSPATVTAGLFDFIKKTATERGDIPPELGLVDYRHDRGGKRWSVKGVGVE